MRERGGGRERERKREKERGRERGREREREKERERERERERAMMKSVDRTPTTRRQKLLLFSGAVCPHLTWPLLIQEFSTTWVEKQLDSITTRYLKRWAGLSKSANTAILYLPHSLGSLNLLLLSTLHQKLQVSRQC